MIFFMAKMTTKETAYDSGSDWDSIETPAVLTFPIRQQSHNEQVADRSAAESDGDPKDPPFDFRSVAAESSTEKSRASRPGKPRKGRRYDPHTSSLSPIASQSPIQDLQHSPSPVTTHSSLHLTVKKDALGNQEVSGDSSLALRASDLKEPIYATVTSKDLRNPQPSQHHREKQKLQQKPEKKKVQFAASVEEGLYNEAFEDSETPGDGVSYCPAAAAKEVEGVLVTHTQREGGTHTWVLVDEEGGLPSYAIVSATNTALQRLCDFTCVPFQLLGLLFHHSIRIVLLRIVRPLLLDSLSLLLQLLLRPLAQAVLAPAAHCANIATAALCATATECLRPVIAVLSAVRVVEVRMGAAQQQGHIL